MSGLTMGKTGPARHEIEEGHLLLLLPLELVGY